MSSLTLDALKKAAAFGRPGIQIIGGRHLECDFALITKQSAPQKRYWLPLAISKDHWLIVRDDVYSCLQALKAAPAMQSHKSVTDVEVLYQFASDIIGRFNRLEINNKDPKDTTGSALWNAVSNTTKAFYQVMQHLVCIACEDPYVVNQADHLMGLAMHGTVSKGYIPHLAHVFMATLISEVTLTTQAKKNLIKQAITRNVVWALKDDPALSYIESDPVSPYRLNRTYKVSKKNYRYHLMCYIFAKTARPEGISMQEFRDSLLKTSGIPSDEQIKEILKAVQTANAVADFPSLLRGFGFSVMPTPANFTSVLRDTVAESHGRRYSNPSLTQEEALKVRIKKEPRVGIAPK